MVFPRHSRPDSAALGNGSALSFVIIPEKAGECQPPISPPYPGAGWGAGKAGFPGSKLRALPAGAQLRLSTFFHPFLPHSTANPAYTNSRSQLCFLEALIL